MGDHQRCVGRDTRKHTKLREGEEGRGWWGLVCRTLAMCRTTIHKHTHTYCRPHDREECAHTQTCVAPNHKCGLKMLRGVCLTQCIDLYQIMLDRAATDRDANIVGTTYHRTGAVARHAR